VASRILLRRGFKSEAERKALTYRENLKIHPCAFLCAFKLAEHLNIPIFKATEFITLPEEIYLLKGSYNNKCEWSALTMGTNAGNTIIIYNPFHSEVRQQSDIMHELAHLICKHQHVQIDHDTELPFGMRSYDKIQEEEAKCLGSTLQLPKPCLLWATKRKMKKEDISSYYNASIDMVTYRLNMTGLFKRLY
jgi:Zn-dependent peptidase ImmA (M78 family)